MAGYVRDRFDGSPSSVAANVDLEVFDWLQKHEGNGRLLSALKWFLKSCRRDGDDLDQVIALSIAFEALLDLPNNTDLAEAAFRKLLDEARVPGPDSIVLLAKTSGLLVTNVTRRFRDKVQTLTESEKITGYAKNLYGVGSKIRHGDLLARGEAMWWGPHRHLHRPFFGRLLFNYLLRELYGEKQAGPDGDDIWNVIRRVDRERMENMLGSDKERLQKIEEILAGDGTAEEKLSNLISESDFLRDRSVGPQDQRAFLDALKKTICAARDYHSVQTDGIAAEIEVVMKTSPEESALQVGEKCHVLAAKATASDIWGLGNLSILRLADYCAWLFGYG
jgi:hypothetical protein